MFKTCKTVGKDCESMVYMDSWIMVNKSESTDWKMTGTVN